MEEKQTVDPRFCPLPEGASFSPKHNWQELERVTKKESYWEKINDDPNHHGYKYAGTRSKDEIVLICYDCGQSKTIWKK